MCFGFDNHFSGDPVSNFLGENKYKAVHTSRRDRLPKECKKESFHHSKTVTVDDRSRMARFEQPIVAVKKVVPPEGSGKSPFLIVHITFQSTGSTNIQCVNALSEVMLYVRQRKKMERQ